MAREVGQGVHQMGFHSKDFRADIPGHVDPVRNAFNEDVWLVQRPGTRCLTS